MVDRSDEHNFRGENSTALRYYSSVDRAFAACSLPLSRVIKCQSARNY